MIYRVSAILLNTFREAIRQKILYVLVLFTLTLMTLSLFLGQLTLGADTKIIKDIGLAAMMLLGSMMAIFMGVGLIYKDVERKTIYTILSKPISRAEFILGKFFGLSLVLLMEMGLMFFFMFLILCLYREPFDWNLVKPTILILAELWVLVSVALVFSSYSSSMMSILFCISFLIVGHLTDDLASVMMPRAQELMAQKDVSDVFYGNVLSFFVQALETISLDHFAINAKVVHGVVVPWGYIYEGVLYSSFLCTLFLSLSALLFSKKDLQ